MSLMDKVGSLLRRPGEDVVPKDEVPMWMKYGGRGLGTIGGGVAIFLGVMNCLGILLADVECLLSGMWQMMAGFLVITVEAPCCCFFIDFVGTFSDWADKRPYWHRAGLYMGIAIPPIIMCFSMSSFFGSGLIFATGVIYGMMALGKKAPLEEMRVAAAHVAPAQPHTEGIRSNLVANSAPMGKSPLPPV